MIMVDLDLFLQRKLQLMPLVLLVLIVSSIPVSAGSIQIAFGAYAKAPQSPTGPTVEDDKLTVEKITDGLEKPTSMAFLGPNDIFGNRKRNGKGYSCNKWADTR
jgi:hypothetical protein